MKVGERRFTWKALEGAGAIDLNACLGTANYAIAYAYAEIESDAERNILLGIGSDDGVKA